MLKDAPIAIYMIADHTHTEPIRFHTMSILKVLEIWNVDPVPFKHIKSYVSQFTDWNWEIKRKYYQIFLDFLHTLRYTFIQQFRLTTQKASTLRIIRPLSGEFTCDCEWWIPLSYKGQWCGKRFQDILMIPMMTYTAISRGAGKHPHKKVMNVGHDMTSNSLDLHDWVFSHNGIHFVKTNDAEFGGLCVEHYWRHMCILQWRHMSVMASQIIGHSSVCSICSDEH